MKRILAIRWVLITLATMPPTTASAAEPPEFQKREFVGRGGEALKYVVYVPTNLAAEKPVPMLIFLHGSSADCVTHERILKESNLQFWHGYDRNVQREPTILMAPVGGQGGWTSASRQQAVFGIIDVLLKEFPVDRRRIYLQGFSMGGGGTWRYLQERPGFFAAANPQALGAGALDAEKIKHTPIWATIGSDDRSLNRMTANVASIRAANGDPRGGLPQVTGVNPRFSVFPGTNHGGAQGATQKIPGFMDWMYAQVNDGNVPPNVRFVQPELAASSQTGTVKAVVAANDPEGKIARVEFYHGDKQVSVDAEEPFEFTYRDLPNGPQVLKVKAVDAGGKSRTDELVIQIGPKVGRAEAPAQPRASQPATPRSVLQDGDRLLFVGGRQLRHLERHVRWSLNHAQQPLNLRGETKFDYNATLRQMAADETVTNLIKNSPAKVVVLASGQIQDGNPTVVANPSVEDMARFADLIQQANKETVLFMTWARNPVGRSNGLEEFRLATEEIVQHVQELQKQKDIRVMPSGLIFYDLTVDPPPALAGQREDYLFNTPNSAEGNLGLLVNVSAFYAVTTGKSPVGLPMWDAYEPAVVKAVQERVWQIVQDWQAGKVHLKPGRRSVEPAAVTAVAPRTAVEPAWPPLVKDGDRLFFIGNSFTGGQGGLFNHLRNVAKVAHPPLRVTTHARIYSGTPLSRMYRDEVVKEIKSGRNAVIVATSGSNADQQRFRDLIAESGAKMAVHLTWGRNPTIGNQQGLSSFRQQTERIVEQGLAFEKKTGVPVVPCGLIFWDLVADPPLPGLREDFVFVYEDIHQNALGTLANVSAHYAVLTGRSPVGLPMWEPYDPRLVKAVQERAWQIVQDWKAGKATVKPAPRPAK